MTDYLNGDWYFNTSSEVIKTFVERVTGQDELSTKEKALRLYYAVRDEIYYNPFRINLKFKSYKATDVLQVKEGHCVDKAGLLITSLRSIGIPARLGLARVRNHIGTSRLEEVLGTDVLVPHGYAEVYLSDTWVKCTPAFNLELCQKLDVPPLDWDGESHSLLQDFNQGENKRMEYLEDFGSFEFIPEDKIVNWMRLEYPHMIDEKGNWKGMPSRTHLNSYQSSSSSLRP